MSIKLMTQVWEIDDPELNGARLLTLLSLADHADDEGGNCYPSIPRIAKRARVSDRQAKRVIQWLEERGYIQIAEKGNGRGHSTRYRIVLKGDALSLNTRNKGDVVSSYSHKKHDTVSPIESVKGDTQRVKGDICDIKGDIAMSPDPPIDPPIDPSEAEGRAAPAAAPTIDPDTAMVWEAWETNMPGVITPKLSDQLNAVIDEYGGRDVVRAIGIAVKRNKRSAGLAYIEGILRRGIDSEPVRGKGDNHARSNGNCTTGNRGERATTTITPDEWRAIQQRPNEGPF